KARANPDRTLARAAELKTRPREASPTAAPPPSEAAKLEAEVKANLDRLSPADRVLALAQRLCPVTDGPLGSPDMGGPVKLMVKGKPVFICCDGCKRKVFARPDEMLNKVEKLRAANSHR